MYRFGWILTLSILGACGSAWGETTDVANISVTDGPVYFGMCDASAAAPLGTRGFIVANDEDNVLRAFSRQQGGTAKTELDLNEFLRPDPKNPETDIEGATWLDKRIFWITSHGRNKDAELRMSRHRLFATEFVRGKDGQTTVRGSGKAYRFLLDDLLLSTKFRKYKLAKA